MTTTFTPDHAAALGGPDWLRERRVAAAERSVGEAMPTADEEVWRYSRIDELDLATFAPAGLLDGDGDRVPAAPTVVPDGARAVLDSLRPVAGAVVVHDGRLVHVELGSTWSDRGVQLGRVVDLAGGEALLGSVAVEAHDLFGVLNDAFTVDPVALVVPRGVVVDAPVVVIDWVDRADLVTFPRLVVQVGEDAEVEVLEYKGGGSQRSLTVPVTELDVAQAGRLRYLDVQLRGADTWQIGTQVSVVGQDANLVAAQAALGGDYARTRADCRLAGRGASGDLVAVYLGEGSQTLDFRTFQDHAAPDTTSNLLFKGAVGGRSRSVYTGLIRVRPEGRGTNAFQTNRTIKLSDDAWAESVPNLEIENNDVHCSHASAVGPIDEDQRFYLESRGVPPQVAERLVVEGFLFEALSQMPIAAARAAVWGEIAVRLARQVEADAHDAVSV
jgi:Fe-S cluster assembly protein SufD